MHYLKVKTAGRSGAKYRPARAQSYIEYKNVDPSVETALYYGFMPLPSPLCVTKDDRDRARGLMDEERTMPFSLAPALDERVALFRHYGEKNPQEDLQPIMYCGEFATGLSKRRSGERRLFLEIMGSSKSIAEATLIQTVLAMLREEGQKEPCLSLNSVGDRESFNRFARELGGYYRKHVASLPQSCRTLFKKNPLDLLECTHEKCRELSEEAPKSIGFLGDESRCHFKEVLEFLEELEIPYRIDHRLLGNRAFTAETLFEITGADEKGEMRPLASGARYNALWKRLGLKRETPSVGANLLLARPAREEPARRIRFKRPMAFFLQLGYRAKLKSLRVIEILRQAGIPIYQALTRDKLISQISSAEYLKTPYSIILGQREALENSVIVRNTSTHAQETVPFSRLAGYMQKLKP